MDKWQCFWLYFCIYVELRPHLTVRHWSQPSLKSIWFYLGCQCPVCHISVDMRLLIFSWYQYMELRYLFKHAFKLEQHIDYLVLLYPPLQRSWKGVYCFHLVRLSVCLSVCGIVSALYLPQYSPDPFDICISYQATSEGVLLAQFVSKLKK